MNFMQNIFSWFFDGDPFFEYSLNLDETKILAIYGAILSTVALLWSIRNSYLDTSKLKINAMIGQIYPTGGDKSYLIFTLTNVGRRPIQVIGLYGINKAAVKGREGLFVVTKNLPKILNEAESLKEFVEVELLNYDLGRLYFSDSHGREWDIRKKDIINLRESAKK
ncbi:hypothetical protein [Leptospira licerasiae]|uniref:hypothetical protein n=1 Tax=Leptospira licerasiae TaxID=447106 RepID=UPI001082A135|nr:hypothetical protein [Leptospira licerasiae]TGM89548.1 hypothetical protein EHR05_10670 [Leptospira licerasiae]